jgi:hypothetical protein
MSVPHSGGARGGSVASSSDLPSNSVPDSMTLAGACATTNRAAVKARSATNNDRFMKITSCR